jgi:hypothetical protein
MISVFIVACSSLIVFDSFFSLLNIKVHILKQADMHLGLANCKNNTTAAAKVYRDRYQ